MSQPARGGSREDNKWHPQVDAWLVFGVAVALAAAVALTTIPSTPDSPTRLQVLSDVIAGRDISNTPYPLGYIVFAALLMRSFGMGGLVWAQVIVFGAMVLLCHQTLRIFAVHRFAAIGGALVVAIHPNILFSVTKFFDTGVSCFLIVALAYLIARLRREGLSTANSVLAGIIWGATLSVRPNAIVLLPVTLWAAFGRRRSIASTAGAVAASAVLALAILAAICVPLKHRFVLFDRYYGAYTFANGTHERALEGILQDYNGEMTMPDTLRESGMPFYPLDRSDPVIADYYMRLGGTFIREHPGRYALLELVKVVNLFRPEYRSANASLSPSLLKKAIATLVPGLFLVWAVIRWKGRHLYGLADGLYVVPFLVLYLAPFIVTNSDPRYRVPIDPIVVMDSILCVSAIRRSRDLPRLREN